MSAAQNRKIGLILSAVLVVCGLLPALHGETGHYLFLVLAPVLFLAAFLRPSLFGGIRRLGALAFSAVAYLALVLPLRAGDEARQRFGQQDSFWRRF